MYYSFKETAFMIEVIDRSKSRPVPCGLVSTLKSLEIGESIIVPAAKKSSIHPAAKRAEVRMTLRTLENGTVCAWRVPSDTNTVPAVTNAQTNTDTKSANATVSVPENVAPAPMATPKSNSIGGYYAEEQSYGPSIFVATELNSFGQPVVPTKQPSTHIS